MSQQGMVINSLEFARQQNTLSGQLAPGALPRLADVLFDNSAKPAQSTSGGKVDFRLAGVAAVKIGGTKSEDHALMLEVDAVLQLVCQRCLGALEYPICIRRRLVLVKPGASWSEDEVELEYSNTDDSDDSDEIEASRELQVAALVEEEILLALPIAPRHENCVAPGNTAATRETSPFAKLVQLKRS